MPLRLKPKKEKGNKHKLARLNFFPPLPNQTLFLGDKR